jgi:hypothetical protein
MGSVVINDFEVLREAQPAAAGGQAAANNSSAAPEPLELQEVKDVLQRLQAEALRVWAH